MDHTWRLRRSTPGRVRRVGYAGLGLWLLAAAAQLLAASPVPSGGPAPPIASALEQFLRQDDYKAVKLSPGGRYLAAVVPDGVIDRLVVMRREDLGRVGEFNPSRRFSVEDYWWANEARLLVAVKWKSELLEAPVPSGQIFAMDPDGRHRTLLAGKGAQRGEPVYAEVIDTLPGDRQHVLIATAPLGEVLGGDDPYTRVERVSVTFRGGITLARAPVRRASFVTDPEGRVRFAVGAGFDNRLKTYYRTGDGAAWELLNDEARSGRAAIPLGFSPDGKVAYLSREEDAGPNGIYAFDPATRAMRLVVRGEFADPSEIIFSFDGKGLIGAVFNEGRPVLRFFDPQHPDARTLRGLQERFPGALVVAASATDDGSLALLSVLSDRAPTAYHLFDTGSGRTEYLLSSRAGVDPQRTAGMRPIALSARDGLDLHGYLTLPADRAPVHLPLVVLPHGGPIAYADAWGFEDEPQLLAAQGYAVLQVNYRGSGRYGRAFRRAGYSEWGGGMIDDLTDAVRWAIAQGIADPARICIYGASYGGYAALMSAAREPNLYRCAAGYAGVYDLPLMFTKGDVPESRSALNYLHEVFEGDDPASISPARLADRIKAPVLLAAGGSDRRAPPAHTRAMAEALQRAGVPVHSLVFPREAHGLADPGNRRRFYGELLAFLDRYLGGPGAGG